MARWSRIPLSKKKRFVSLFSVADCEHVVRKFETLLRTGRTNAMCIPCVRATENNEMVNVNPVLCATSTRFHCAYCAYQIFNVSGHPDDYLCTKIHCWYQIYLNAVRCGALVLRKYGATYDRRSDGSKAAEKFLCAVIRHWKTLVKMRKAMSERQVVYYREMAIWYSHMFFCPECLKLGR